MLTTICKTTFSKINQHARFILCLIAFGLVSRLLPHPPNCTAINAIALLSGSYLGSLPLSFATTLLTLFLTDIVLGVHTTMPYVYLSIGLIALLGHTRKNSSSLLGYSLISSTIFFIVTNLGVWLSSSLYPETLYGLTLCYIAALPFFTFQIIGDMLYLFLMHMVFANYSKKYLENFSHHF